MGDHEPIPNPTPSIPGSDFISTDDLNALGNAIKVITTLGPDALETAGKNALFEAKKDLTNWAGGLGLFTKALPDLLSTIEKDAASWLSPFVKILIQSILSILIPVAETFGQASEAYIGKLVDSITGNEPAQQRWSELAHGLGAQAMFDDIVSPLAGLTGAKDPDTYSNGIVNIQRSLGGIVSLHLMTWVLNVVSNLTGIGELKFMNSFNEVALAALNARNLGRMAMRPFRDTYMVQPSTQALNQKWPLKTLSESALIKAYLRGALTTEQAQTQLRYAGYKEGFAAQFLADSLKFINDPTVARMVNLGWWTQEQAIAYMKLQGWDDSMAGTNLKINLLNRVFSVLTDIAERLEAQLLAGQIELPDYQDMLRSMGFSDLEVEWLSIKAQSKVDPPKKFTYSQLKSLFDNNLIDLNRVQDELLSMGYSFDDATLLILLDMTEKKLWNERRAVLAARARLLQAELTDRADAAVNQGRQAIATAERALAQKEAAFASALGG